VKMSTRAPARRKPADRPEWVSFRLGRDVDVLEGLERIAAYLADHPGERPGGPDPRPGRRRRPGRTDALRAAVAEMLRRIDTEQA
jgi:hypothetical protein